MLIPSVVHSMDENTNLALEISLKKLIFVQHSYLLNNFENATLCSLTTVFMKFIMERSHDGANLYLSYISTSFVTC